ncbi:acetylcholinesterase-like [Brevipalpus obovatus]|uniref:acetylcholinesterase-like n=1 Tax=Brevipalpus obovatus TaxID=246614 RepID=UPI003D9DB23B
MAILMVLFSTCLSVVLGGDQNLKYTPIVKTLTGPVQGKVMSFKDGEANYFLGIPYAQPPTGDLRFQDPRPVTAWTDVLKATEISDSCMQPRLSLYYVRRSISEDCLYLNVITPANALSDKSKKRPVLISILHNDFLTLSGNDEIDIKSKLVRQQDIILVTPNVRLGFFGYAYTKEDDGSLNGNYGLMDENMAIRWVKQNIDKFGGDPDSITLRGQGSGARNVRAHIISPYGRGLAKNAIVESQVLFEPGINVNQRVDLSTKIVLKRVGCYDVKDRIKCLSDVDGEKLVSATPERFVPFSPVLESDYLPIPDGLVAVENANDVNLLMGYNKDDSSLALAIDAPETFADAQLTLEDAQDIVSIFVDSNSAKEVLQLFLDGNDKKLSIRKLQRALIDFVNFIAFSCKIYLVAEATAENENLKKGVYTFIFDHKPATSEYPICDLDEELGICFRSEQPFIYGEPFDDPYFYSDKDRKVSEYMMNIVGTFMRTGRPPMTNGKEWPNWNDPKSKKPNVGSLVIESSLSGMIDRKDPEFCLKNWNYVNSTLLDKYYVLDLYKMEKQAKVDKKSSYDGHLYSSIEYGLYQEY